MIACFLESGLLPIDLFKVFEVNVVYLYPFFLVVFRILFYEFTKMSLLQKGNKLFLTLHPGLL